MGIIAVVFAGSVIREGFGKIVAIIECRFFLAVIFNTRSSRLVGYRKEATIAA